MRAGAVLVAVAVIACAALLAAGEAARFTSKKAQEAQKKYEGALERLRAEHEAKVQKVRAKAAARKIGEYTFSGGSGTSIEDAIVIGGAEDSAGAVDAQGVWIRANHPGFKKGDQALLSQDGKHYDKITIEGPDGKKKVVYFDITTCFGLPGLDE